MFDCHLIAGFRLYSFDERTSAGRYLPISLPLVGSKSNQII
jgi:hypothetical protein